MVALAVSISSVILRASAAPNDKPPVFERKLTAPSQGAYAMAVTKDKIYVTNMFESRIDVIDRNGNLTGTIGSRGSALGVIGSRQNDMIKGDNGRNWLIGGGGNDVLDGDAGQDRLDGGAGNDACPDSGVPTFRTSCE